MIRLLPAACAPIRVAKLISTHKSLPEDDPIPKGFPADKQTTHSHVNAQQQTTIINI